MRTVLKYPGSKWNIAPRLVELIPEHHSYVEPFFGSGAVLFNKPVSDIETINDLDHDVVNLFRCIQEDAERLSRMVMTTPFSREKYEDTYKLDVWELMMPDEPYHKALRFLIQCWQGHGFRTNGSKVGWKNDVQGRERAYALWNWYRLPEWIIDMANVSAGQDNTMVLVEGWRDYGIYADKDTGVMYLVYQRNGTGCTVMLNA